MIIIIIIGVETCWVGLTLAITCLLAIGLIGASLSEPHTSGTALRRCVCMYVCIRPTVLAAIYRKF